MLTNEIINELSAKTKFSPEKIQEWNTRFLSFTSSKTGQLSKKKFIKLYKEILPEKGDSESFSIFVFKGNFICFNLKNSF